MGISEIDEQKNNAEMFSVSDCTRKALESSSPERHFSLRALQDLVWEKLHTGHWKDVDVGWRSLFSAVAAARVVMMAGEGTHVKEESELISDLVRLSDLGWIMGGESVCSDLAQALNDICKRFVGSGEPCVKRVKLSFQTPTVPKSSANITRLVTLPAMGLEDFILNHRDRQTPCLISGLMDNWPAVSGEADQRWGFHWLVDNFGFRSVPVELGERYTDTTWTQTIMTIKEFVDKYIMDRGKGATTGYLAQHPLLDQIPELKEGIEIPDLCYTGDEATSHPVDLNAWFGPAGTVSPLHTDPRHNLLCQVVGTKYVRLYPESQTAAMYPHEGEMLSNTSRVDLEAVDETAFPDFGSAVGFECVLEEGQILYIPPKCWHFVKSLSESMSVSMWFD